MSDYPMLISNKLHSFRNFCDTNIQYIYISLYTISAKLNKSNVNHVIEAKIHKN